MSRRANRRAPLTPNFLVVTSAAILALAAACAKSESGAPAPATSSTATAVSPVASAAPPTSASTAAVVAAADTATTAKDAADAGRTVAEVKKDAGAASSPAASASAGPAECGTKPQPDCPLQAWMKANANPPVMTSDLAALATALDKIVGFGPAGYANWASIAKDGAAAARSGDLTAAKASCRSCHDQYKQKYKTEMRARKI
jgi:hypothetical protein